MAASAVLTPLYNFSANTGNYQNSDGISPAGLTLGPNGDFYGLAQSGGRDGDGTLFTLHTDGTGFTTLHDFDAGDGFLPLGTLTVGANGSLEGVAPNGGMNGTGLIFRLLPDGSQYTSLYAFSATDSNGFNTDGSAPNAALLLGTDGSFYGTTQFGGLDGEGVLYQLNADGSRLVVLHIFTGGTADGAYPTCGLTAGPDGTLYGTTGFGGANNAGTVFRIRSDGSGFSVIYSFAAYDSQSQNLGGAVPAAALILGQDGLLYGSAEVGGSGGAGVLFRIGTDGSGYDVLHIFSAADSSNANPDGAYPTLALVQDAAENLYGTTVTGGANGDGTLFQIHPDGSAFTLLETFGSNAGQNPAGLILDGSGLICGTTTGGGTNGTGTIFHLAVSGSPAPHLASGATRVLWESTDGMAALWNYDPTAGSFTQNIYGPYSQWTAKAVADGGTDGQTRLLWNNTNGMAALWNVTAMTGAFTVASFGPYPGWTANAVSVGSGNTTHLLWTNTDGTAALWNIIRGQYQREHDFGPYPGWTAQALADSPDGSTRLLWTNTDGQAAIWSLNSTTSAFTDYEFGPYPGWTAKTLSVGAGGTTHVLWDNTDGTAAVWNYDSTSGRFGQKLYGPYANWSANGLADASDGTTRLLWNNVDGTASFWSLDNVTGLFSQFSFGPYSNWIAAALSAAS